jgi:hypothetical protein
VVAVGVVGGDGPELVAGGGGGDLVVLVDLVGAGSPGQARGVVGQYRLPLAAMAPW